jgi:hypothetical protein
VHAGMCVVAGVSTGEVLLGHGDGGLILLGSPSIAARCVLQGKYV